MNDEKIGLEVDHVVKHLHSSILELAEDIIIMVNLDNIKKAASMMSRRGWAYDLKLKTETTKNNRILATMELQWYKNLIPKSQDEWAQDFRECLEIALK